MPVSPFPGIDPYLEGGLWLDVQKRLTAVLSELIASQVSPKYTTRLETYIVKDYSFREDTGIMYPEAKIFYPEKVTDDSIFSIPTLEIEKLDIPELSIPFIEIRKNRTLITCIELTSPANKRMPTLAEYRRKRQSMVKSRVHFLEIDLIRRGTRTLDEPLAPKSDYRATLYRADLRRTQFWTFDLQDKMPILPVPLKSPDPDAILELKKALDTTYERGMYHLSINYSENPPPPLTEETEKATWVKSQAKKGAK